jgi:hypothetical protein
MSAAWDVLDIERLTDAALDGFAQELLGVDFADLPYALRLRILRSLKSVVTEKRTNEQESEVARRSQR